MEKNKYKEPFLKCLIFLTCFFVQTFAKGQRKTDMGYIDKFYKDTHWILSTREDIDFIFKWNDPSNSLKKSETFSNDTLILKFGCDSGFVRTVVFNVWKEKVSGLDQLTFKTESIANEYLCKILKLNRERWKKLNDTTYRSKRAFHVEILKRGNIIEYKYFE